MQRIVVNRSATLPKDFAFTPTGTPTVAVTRDDGTAVTVGTVLATADPTVFEYTIPSTSNTQLDILTETWTAVSGGQSQTFTDTIEVAGGVLFTIDQARALKPLNDTTMYPTAKIIEARTMVESALEDACGVAFVPRFKRQWVSGNGRSTILLAPKARAIRSVTLDDTAVSNALTDTMRVMPTGEVYYPSWWQTGYANYEVAYEHGYDSPPPRVSQAALLWAKTFLVSGPIDARTTSMSTEDGTFSLATPGLRGSHTGIPEVDAVIQQYALHVAVA